MADSTADTATPDVPASTPPVPTPRDVAEKTGAAQPASTPPAAQQEGSKEQQPAVTLEQLQQAQTEARENAAKLDAVLVALGVKQGSGQVDPDQIAKELAASRAESAILRIGAGIADTDALLDSKRFTESLNGLDLNDRDKVKAHIEAFVQANPRYAASTPSGPVPGVRDAATTPPPDSGQSGDWLRDQIRK